MAIIDLDIAFGGGGSVLGDAPFDDFLGDLSGSLVTLEAVGRFVFKAALGGSVLGDATFDDFCFILGDLSGSLVTCEVEGRFVFEAAFSL